MFDESSSPAFFKIDKDDNGSSYAIREHDKVPTEFRPEIPLQADSVKDTDWDNAGVEMEIALIAIPNIVPIPFGTEINSTTADDDFTDEMKKYQMSMVSGPRRWATWSTSSKLTTTPRRFSSA
jgi:hypothetical protein